MYDLDPPVPMRGSFTYYWFSDNASLNRLGCRLYFPILRYMLNSRPYSSFEVESARVSWCESGNNIVMDDLTVIGEGRPSN